MQKILVLDHKFNIQSISSCSKIDPSITFYGLDSKFSFYDNIDHINPDIVWLNTYFIDSKLQETATNSSLSIIKYHIDYLLPNIFALSPNNEIQQNIPCFLFDTFSIPNFDKIYHYNSYVKFYTINCDINHIQHMGNLDSCKDMTNIIMSSEKILSNSTIIKNFAAYYNKHYAIFKPNGTISWRKHSLQMTNKDLFLQNV